MKTYNPRSLYFFWTIFGFFLLSCSPVFSQDQPAHADSVGFLLLEKVATYRAANDLGKANQSALQAGQVFQQQKNWKGWADAYDALYKNNRMAKTDQEFQTIITYFEQADSLLKTLPESAPIARAHVLGRTAYLYHILGEYQDALRYYERSFEPAEKAGETDFLLRLYSSAATVLWAIGDDYRSLSYREKALTMAIELQDTISMAYNLKNLGNAWRTVAPVKAIPAYQQALELTPDNAEILMLLSKAYLTEGVKDHERAFQTVHQSLQLAREDEEKSDALHQLGRVYFDTQQFDRAILNYEKALTFGKRGYGASHQECAKIYKFIGDALLAKKQFEKALIAYNQCLSALLPLFKPQSANQNPDLIALTNTSIWILESLQGKSKTFTEQYQVSKDLADQQQALETAELAVQYLQQLKSGYGEDESKYNLHDGYFSVCGMAMALAFDLAKSTGEDRYLHKAFAISENNKAVVLAEALYRKEVKHLAGVSDSMLTLEKSFYENIAYWKKQLRRAATPADLKTYKDSLFIAKRLLESFEQQLEKDYPDYARTKFTHLAQQQISDIQKELPDSSVLLEYFLGDTAIYIFVITPDQFLGTSRGRTSAFDLTLDKFLQATNDWTFVQDSSRQASADYLAAGWQLYDYLLKSPLEKVNANRLIIIPDGKLGLISFDLLLTTPYNGNWTDRAVPFLLKDYAVSYQFASKFLNNKKNTSIGDWGGFGAEHSGLSSIDSEKNTINDLVLRDEGRLPFADDEVRTIADFLGGASWLNEAATRDNFLKHAEKYGILHLATHGIVDRKDPLRSRLLFSQSAAGEDHAVYAHEIYGLQLKAGLTVLSACNTGSGTWKRGEGTMSLARAFAFAGCPSLVMSLWSVSDQSTGKIMTDFYKNLYAGQSKDCALQNAKLHYLETTSAEYTKPVYWASFVAIGDMSSLPVMNERKSWSLWKTSLAGIFAIAILLFLWSRRIT